MLSSDHNRDNLTCEQRRAIEYGIEPWQQDLGDEITTKPLTPSEQHDKEAAMCSAMPEGRKADPLPDPRKFADPIVFSLHLGDWARRHGVTVKAAVAMYSRKPYQQERADERAKFGTALVQERRHPVDHDVLPWKPSEYEYPYESGRFTGQGEGQDR